MGSTQWYQGHCVERFWRPADQHWPLMWHWAKSKDRARLCFNVCKVRMITAMTLSSGLRKINHNVRGLLFYLFIYLLTYLLIRFLSERESVWAQRRSRGRKTSRLHPEHAAQWGLISEPWDHDLSQNQESMLSQLSHSGAPWSSFSMKWMFY